jgi:hypothetical protein
VLNIEWVEIEINISIILSMSREIGSKIGGKVGRKIGGETGDEVPGVIHIPGVRYHKLTITQERVSILGGGISRSSMSTEEGFKEIVLLARAHNEAHEGEEPEEIKSTNRELPTNLRYKGKDH